MNLDYFVQKVDAKLLSELGFNQPVFAYYDELELKIEKYFRNPENLNSKFLRFKKLDEPKYSAPTIDQALNWIFDEFNIFIQFFYQNKKFSFNVYNLSDNSTLMFTSDTFTESLTESKKIALSHILLILQVSFIES